MKSNEKVSAQIFEIIENQMKNNDPPETNFTYNRLIKDGFSDFNAKQLIGRCIAVEIFEILKYKKQFDSIRFIKNLNNLPDEPFEE